MSAIQIAGALKSKISFKAFVQGMGVACLFWVLLLFWIYLGAPDALNKQQARLASQTVLIDRTALEVDKHTVTGGDVSGEVAGPDPVETQPDPAGAPTEYTPPSVMESGLAEAPIDGLYDDTPFGRRPAIRTQDGLTAYKAYKRPFDVYATKNAIVSIAIAGLGLSDVATESALRSMPPDVSFVMSPYANAPQFWVTEARQRGHEVWFTLPLESNNYPVDDPGPHTMLISAPERENMTKLEWLLTRADGYVGFVTSYNPAFMGSVNDMRPVIGDIYNRGLAFVDGSYDPGMVPQTMAAGAKAPYSNVDVWVDKPYATQDFINASLAELEQKAKKNGYAVGVIQALPVSYQQVLKWLESLEDKGLTLAPLSATTGY